MGVNDTERRRWNDEHWTSSWPRRERLTGAVTPLLLDRLAPRAGQRLLEVGSGGGIAALAAAQRVGPEGAVVGADISAPLVGLASRRAGEAGRTEVRFVVADAQHERIEGAPFDGALSQFGVMFFEDSAAGFANIRNHVKPGGQLVFACWQAPARNPWFVGPALAPFVPAPPQPPAGQSAPGPFSLADPDRTRAVLEKAGWSRIERTEHEVTVTVAPDTIIDDAQLEFLGVDPGRLGEARTAVESHLAPLRRDDGGYEAPLAFQIFSARA